MADDPFVLCGTSFTSRLIMGTGGAPSLDVLELALVEAVSAGRHAIDTEDLLLGFVRRAEQGEGQAAGALTVLGTSADAVRKAVADLRDG